MALASWPVATRQGPGDNWGRATVRARYALDLRVVPLLYAVRLPVRRRQALRATPVGWGPPPRSDDRYGDRLTGSHIRSAMVTEVDACSVLHNRLQGRT